MTMTAYLDTSAVMALALPFDRLHEAAGNAWDDVAAHVKPWGWLHDLEVRQTLRNLAQRNPAPAPRAALEQVASELRMDVSRGVYQRVRLEDTDLSHRAELLAAAHGSRRVVGAFDLLHVAAAELSAADLSVTGDANQAAVAPKLPASRSASCRTLKHPPRDRPAALVGVEHGEVGAAGSAFVLRLAGEADGFGAVGEAPRTRPETDRPSTL